jgi:hypothetical protein
MSIADARRSGEPGCESVAQRVHPASRDGSPPQFRPTAVDSSAAGRDSEREQALTIEFSWTGYRGGR